MEPLQFFLKGIAAGFVVAAPVGPVAILCVRRTLAYGLRSGWATGLGATVADTLYGVVAAYGVGFVASLLFEHDFWFRLIGGVLLLVLAIKTLLTGPIEARTTSREGLMGDLLSALVLTGTNPITLVAFGVVFASIGVATTEDVFIREEALIAGVFVGAALWWGSLAGIAGVFRTTISHAGLRWINRVSASVILACGIFVLICAIAPESPVAQFLNARLGARGG